MANSLSHENRFSPIQRDQDKNASIESLFKELKSAIVVLLQKGIKYILVTLGPDGAFLCSGSGPSGLRECLNDTKYSDGKSELFDMVSSRCSTHQYFCSTPCKGGSQLFVMHFPALPAIVRGVSGAGDCLVGGILSSLCSGLDVMQSVAVGVAAAKAAIEVETNVPSTYDLTAVAGTSLTQPLNPIFLFGRALEGTVGIPLKYEENRYKDERNSPQPFPLLSPSFLFIRMIGFQYYVSPWFLKLGLEIEGDTH